MHTLHFEVQVGPPVTLSPRQNGVLLANSSPLVPELTSAPLLMKSSTRLELIEIFKISNK
jgi:hypothetical protein